jgi:hypothetical protein
MKVLRWIWRHWYIPVLAIVGAVGFLIGWRSRHPSPLDSARRELEAIDEGERARVIEIEKGKEAANAHADLMHSQAIENLTTTQREKADRLRNDPARRARYLSRVSRRRPDDAI